MLKGQNLLFLSMSLIGVGETHDKVDTHIYEGHCASLY
jgi:hypothetical protein